MVGATPGLPLTDADSMIASGRRWPPNLGGATGAAFGDDTSGAGSVHRGRRAGPPQCCLHPERNPTAPSALPSRTHRKGQRTMKGILAWLIGIPIPLIMLLYLLDVF